MTEEKIREIAVSFQQSRILLSAFELGIFSAIGENELDSSLIAKQIGTDDRATNRLCNALVTLGFLEKQNGKFSNSDTAKKYLVKESPQFLSNLYHTNHLWNSWSGLTESVKLGHSVQDDEIVERNDDWRESFIEAMHHRAEDQAKEIAEYLDLTNVKTTLDIGGGSGAFSFGFINKNPNIQAFIFDLPNIIPITEKYVNQYNKKERIKLLKGDYLKDSFGGIYDLIFLSAIIHINSFEENKYLIKKCADSLSSTGTIVISDFVMSEDRLSPPRGTFFALNMLVGTKSGDTFTQNEITEWYRSAGLEFEKRIDTSFGSTLIIGKR